MYRLHLTLVVAMAGAGCAATPPEPIASTAGAPLALNAIAEPVKVEMTELEDNSQTRCRDVTRTGSRIVVARECWEPGQEVKDEEQLARELEQLREEQDYLNRRRQEEEDRRRRRDGVPWGNL